MAKYLRRWAIFWQVKPVFASLLSQKLVPYLPSFNHLTRHLIMIMNQITIIQAACLTCLLHPWDKVPFIDVIVIILTRILMILKANLI